MSLLPFKRYLLCKECFSEAQFSEALNCTEAWQSQRQYCHFFRFFNIVQTNLSPLLCYANPNKHSITSFLTLFKSNCLCFANSNCSDTWRHNGSVSGASPAAATLRVFQDTIHCFDSTLWVFHDQSIFSAKRSRIFQWTSLSEAQANESVIPSEAWQAQWQRFQRFPIDNCRQCQFAFVRYQSRRE